MRKVKIVATIGPSSQDLNVLTDMIRAGVNVARLNMSHGDYDFHQKTIDLVREASKLAAKEVAILVDLQGPKIRVGALTENLKLEAGAEWYLGTLKNKGDHENFIPTVYEKLVDDVDLGQAVLFDDGLLEATVVEKLENLVKIKVKTGGILKQKKGINLPETQVSAPSLTDKDKDDLFWAVDNAEVDFVALSFVRTADDILEVKKLMRKQSRSIPVIAKIEKPEAITNIESIVDATDGIMIARGDMAVEVGAHIVPKVQKQIIRLCNYKSKPVITATQMLESMTNNTTPTRAEASDVANAVWDGTDAVMLSGETASGLHPVLVVQTMEKIIKEAETMGKKRNPTLEDSSSYTSNIQQASAVLAEKIEARALVVLTNGGRSCQKLSSYRPRAPIWAVTNNRAAVRSLCLTWGVKPFWLRKDSITESEVEQFLSKLVDKKLIPEGSVFVVNRSVNQDQVQENFITIKTAKKSIE